ncbi:MAG: hypothetical protein WA151_09090 [Desulfatirhabdiaceae bacterium]
MNTIDLDDVVVTYEGQKLPVKILMKRLQDQLRDTANRLNSIAYAINELHTSMENSRIVEVKLTLSQTEYDKFKLIGGETDHDRLRNAIQVMNEKTPTTAGKVSDIPVVPIVPIVPVVSEKMHPPLTMSSLAEPEPDESVGKKKSALTRCPRCKNLLDIPDVPADQWPVEVKCGSCGAKCLIKSKTSASRSDRSGLESMDDLDHGNLFDMLST